MRAKSRRLCCKTDFSAWLEDAQYGCDLTHTSSHSWSLSSCRVSLSGPFLSSEIPFYTSCTQLLIQKWHILLLESCCPVLAWVRILSSITFHECCSPELLLALYPSDHLADILSLSTLEPARCFRQGRLRAGTGQGGGCAAVNIDQWQAHKPGVAYNRQDTRKQFLRSARQNIYKSWNNPKRGLILELPVLDDMSVFSSSSDSL